MSIKLYHKSIFALIIISLFLPLFSFAQEGPLIEMPGTIEEGKTMTESGIKRVINDSPNIFKRIWREEAVPIWRKMWDYFKGNWASFIKQKLSNFWNYFLKPKISFLIQKIGGLIGREIEEKTPTIKEEFKQEAEEMKEEIPTVWERFKRLFK